ncbi:MAG: heavy metal translocating P-type ATPase, partial [Micrococcales bacterium]|nr:heavy metal translocating P-type ATPase [Micrococcales bacterium]
PWVVAALALPVAGWCAWPFHAAAFRAARHGASTMDTLVSLGVVAASAWSLVVLILGDALHSSIGIGLPGPGRHHGEDLYFEVAAVVTVFLLAGRVLESRARRRGGDALRALLDLGARDVEVVGATARVPIDQLAPGDLFTVRPGEKVATDGVVVTGVSALDLSFLTGETRPVDVGPGDQVTGATLNTWGLLTVRATRVGSHTRLAQIARLVTQAQQSKAPVQRLADKISSVFVPVVLVLSLATLAAWLALGRGVGSAFTAAVAVLVIACPCALGLATPTALVAGCGRGAQLGILIKGPEILESARAVTTVLLDKTGTLTSGRLFVTDIITADDDDPGVALNIAGALEAGSTHPLAAPIVAKARKRDATKPVEDFVSHPGLGLTGLVDGQRTAVGRLSWLREQGYTTPDHLSQTEARAHESGASTVSVGWEGKVRAVIVLRDEARDEAPRVVSELRGLGLTPILLTGDAEGAAREVAREVGISEVIAEVQPEEKIDAVRRLQAAGEVVAMVGDGVNDAAALAQADLGIALGSGTDAAIEAADLTIVRESLQAIPQAIRLSRLTLRRIRQNLFWAFAYNVAALPLAAFGLLNPMIAGATMAASSVIVVTNSLRLRRFGPLVGSHLGTGYRAEDPGSGSGPTPGV